jgi:inhibitor of cysteine peptidase
MMRLISTIAAVTFAAALCAGCPTQSPAPSTPTLTEKDLGQSVELAVGSTVKVVLDSNPSTGYRWDVAAVDAKVLRTAGESSSTHESGGPAPMPGTPEKAILSFQAVAPGQTTLQLAYHQPWMKDVPPAKTFSVNFTVK